MGSRAREAEAKSWQSAAASGTLLGQAAPSARGTARGEKLEAIQKRAVTHTVFSVSLPCHFHRLPSTAQGDLSQCVTCVLGGTSWDSWAGCTSAGVIPASASRVAIETTAVPEPASTGSPELVTDLYLGNWRRSMAPTVLGVLDRRTPSLSMTWLQPMNITSALHFSL